MAPGIGAGGSVGIALEAVAGTYTAPTKFTPVNNESLQQMNATQFRRPIRMSADAIHAVPGDMHIAGDIEFDAYEDVLALLMHCARADVVKGGTSPNFTYTFTPTAAAVPARTMSLTVVRNGVVFGYTGCVVSSWKLSVADGVLIAGVSILGRDEATQTDPTEVWPITTPYGAGTYSIEIPTGTPVLDTDTFEFTCEDNGEPQFRLKNTGRGAQFIKYGERALTTTLGRDFESRTDYDAFKAVTGQSVTLAASKGTNNSISLLLPATIKETYELGMSGQGDLIRASIGYQSILGSPASYQLDIATQEDIIP